MGGGGVEREREVECSTNHGPPQNGVAENGGGRGVGLGGGEHGVEEG